MVKWQRTTGRFSCLVLLWKCRVWNYQIGNHLVFVSRFMCELTMKKAKFFNGRLVFYYFELWKIKANRTTSVHFKPSRSMFITSCNLTELLNKADPCLWNLAILQNCYHFKYFWNLTSSDIRPFCGDFIIPVLNSRRSFADRFCDLHAMVFRVTSSATLSWHLDY